MLIIIIVVSSQFRRYLTISDIRNEIIAAIVQKNNSNVKKKLSIEDIYKAALAENESISWYRLLQLFVV